MCIVSFFCVKFYCLRWDHCISLFYSFDVTGDRFKLNMSPSKSRHFAEKQSHNYLRYVSMSGSETGFSKYLVSGSHNVKSLFIWLNTNFGEPITQYM